MNRIKPAAVALLAGFAGFAPGARTENKWYAGLDIGRSKADATIAGFQFNEFSTEGGDGSDTGYRFRVGYQFARYFAAEVGYADFGNFEFNFDPDFCPGNLPTPCPFTAHTSISGFVADVVGRLPIGKQWAIYARAGLFNLGVDTDPVAGRPIGSSEDMGGLQLGLGVSYRVADHWELLLDYTKFEQVDFSITVGGQVGAFSFGDTQLTSLGMNYRW